MAINMLCTKVSRALLCCCRVRLASVMACSISARTMGTANPLMRIDGNDAGTRSRAATALAMALDIRRSPFNFAANGLSCAVAITPGIRSAMGSADHSGLAEGGEHLIDVMQEG